jgi:hypothetical protein
MKRKFSPFFLTFSFWVYPGGDRAGGEGRVGGGNVLRGSAQDQQQTVRRMPLRQAVQVQARQGRGHQGTYFHARCPYKSAVGSDPHSFGWIRIRIGNKESGSRSIGTDQN